MISIVLPTYNERKNISVLINSIFNVFKENDLNGNIIVVDDNSPDGTEFEIKKLISNYNNIHLIKRSKKMGLGSAYIIGFKKALSMGSKYIFEMDADLSHNPKDIPKFINMAKSNDIVLGSRYIKGGNVKNWNLFRKIISRGGTIYAKTILNLPIHDLTSGYKCFKNRVLRDINLNKIKSEGYAFQIELTYYAFKKKYNIVEMPITFTDRKRGSSKFDKSIFWEAVLMVWRLRLKCK